MGTLDFNTWWTRPVVVSVQKDDKRYYSRQNLVLNVADTDGGAHVDEGLEEIYDELSRKNGLGISAIYRGEKYPLIYPELPCLRQIGHEVLLTLKKTKPNFFDEHYDDEIEFIPFGMEIDDQDPKEEIGLEIYFRKSIINGYRDREEPRNSPLPHHAAYGSVLRDSADQASSDPGKRKSK